MLKRLRSQSEEEGFTLIELLIVIIILGILAAIVVFAIGNTKKDASNASCTTDVKSIALAEEAYFTHNSAYASDSGLTDPTGGNLKSMPSLGGAPLSVTGTATSYTITVPANAAGSGVTGGSVTSAALDADTNTACAGA